MSHAGSTSSGSGPLIRGVLFDLDGVLSVDGVPLPGAPETLDFLRDAGIPYRILTNTTTMSVATLLEQLRASGLAVPEGALQNAPSTAAAQLQAEGVRRVRLVLTEDARRDFAAFDEVAVNQTPEALVVGDIGNAWSAALMQSLFENLMDGARLVALHKGRYWKAGGKLCMDLGAWVAGLEYTSGVEAEVVGKPSRAFFRVAMRGLGIGAAELLMVGDDLHNDIGGAHAVGIRAVLVRTGKYRDGDLERAELRPWRVLESVAELPKLLERERG